MESRMTELMEAIQESEGQAERRVLTLLGGRCISEKALVIDGKIVWESRKNGYFHGYTDEIKNITESGITYIGNEKVFCDTLGQEKQIVICGAGHVSIPVIKMAVMMDCEVIVLEDRPMYADHARLAGASQVICEPFEEALDKIQGSADTYFVILTRGHRYDQICLEKIAAKEHAYIGMIGSRRRTALVKQSLAEKGVDQEVLDAVYTLHPAPPDPRLFPPDFVLPVLFFCGFRSYRYRHALLRLFSPDRFGHTGVLSSGSQNTYPHFPVSCPVLLRMVRR